MQMDEIIGLWCLLQHSVDMLLTDPPYGPTRNIWDISLLLPEFWEAVQWACQTQRRDPAVCTIRIWTDVPSLRFLFTIVC